ncbi:MULTISPECIES: response regulator [Herbaspirillum]|uniref:Response regulator for colanic capsule biosynthesis protein n=1 Tax=Herbaspirillum frisingense GSF30 TaxID=864073 RepID=A0AAI9IGH4_9BURK|nr:MULTISPECIES: response regulator transcription factor [Herbaspirillum]EOA05697.1 response regulator for colanic capsule biosynthesis protein [Herbaspirillum frisingense GSF30]MCI1013449.1 response regulator transcription factor [Herbaspirillum sp. C7C2]ONN64787.1 DNA-binding response regulator [Herbaspirillum sp. VT-16-41]QNB06809.1 response regulator transcription factor [Herbaspirillum frisingense]UIN22952.1 response regulator transcription factor [Herbaspirillum frisingense]
MNLKKILHVAIADDHPIVLGALRSELARLPEIRIDLEVDTGEALLAALKRAPCEIVITDFAMPADDSDDSDGFALVKRIKNEHPSTKLIVYTAMNNGAVIRRLYRMGVFAVINKREKTDELINACLATQSSKQLYFPVSLRGELEMSWAQGEGFGLVRELTQSELEVVRLFVEGQSLGEICERLSRTPSTISTHKNNAMRKLGLSTDADLIKYAYSTGMIN